MEESYVKGGVKALGSSVKQPGGPVAFLRRHGRVGLAVAVVIVGLVEWGLHHHHASRAPTMRQWRELQPSLIAQLVRQKAQTKKKKAPLVVVAPAWAEPMARAVLGDDWMPLSHVARPDDTAFAGVVEVSLLGARADLPGWSQQWYQAFGPFELRGWNNPEAATVLLDFVDELGPAGVSVRTLKSGRAQVCPYGKRRVSNGDLHGHSTFPAQRFACAGGNWHFVGVTVIEDQNYRPRRCIWAHPGQNETLQIEFLDVVVGSELRGYGGLPYFRGRQSHGTPVEMEVLVGGHSLGAYTHKDGEGWSPFRWSTESWKGRRMDVQFQIRSRRVAHREFCFQADLR